MKQSAQHRRDKSPEEGAKMAANALAITGTATGTASTSQGCHAAAAETVDASNNPAAGQLLS